MKRVLVTGANGFVGRAVCDRLEGADFLVRRAVRQHSHGIGGEWVAVGDIGSRTDWRAALEGVDAVVHLAARVHVMEESAQEPLAAFREVNVAGTERLARAAGEAGVRRLVFLGSIKVNGESTPPPLPDPPPRGGRGAFREDDPPAPRDPYAVSKWEAEQALHRVAAETGLEVAILRPPLVYGPGVKANFLRLMEWVDRGVPLPLGSVQNRRSLVFVENLADAIVTCLTHPGAAGKTYLVSDGEDVSTSELIMRLAQALGRPARLLPFPPGMLRLAGALAGKRAEVERLLDSLEIDSSRIRRELGWQPPYSMEQGLAETARWYRRR